MSEAKTVFEVVKKYVRGDKRGKNETSQVTLHSPKTIHSYLWDMAEKFEKNKINYVIEFYKEVKTTEQ